jgi:hypothetical protein
MWGESLFRLTSRDVQARQVDPFFRNTRQQSGATPDAISYVVPEGHILQIDHWYALAIPQALVAINAGVVQFQNPGVAIAVKSAEIIIPLPASNEFQFTMTSNPVILTAGCSFALIVTWSAANAANLLEFGVVGLLLPAGNVERI